MEVWHGLASWCFRGFQETGAGLWADDGANSVSHAGSSLAAANLHLAELRSVPEISSAEGFSQLLGEVAGGTVVLGDSGPLQADQARRTARRRRRVPAALSQISARGKGALAPRPPRPFFEAS